jgi:putative transposase
LADRSAWCTSAGNGFGGEHLMIEFKGRHFERDVILWGATVDFLLTAKRDRKAASRFLRKAIGRNGTPEKITTDKSGANTAAIESHNVETEAGIEIRQIKYLNSLVEQDHRAIKRLVRPTLGFKSFRSAAVTLAGVELMHMIRKGQLRTTGEVCPARQFYSMAG